MKQINLNFLLKNLSGEDIPESNAGKIIANILAADNGKNPIKFYAWAKELYAGKEISIDPQDLELLKTFITDHQQITAMAKSQVLEVINK